VKTIATQSRPSGVSPSPSAARSGRHERRTDEEQHRRQRVARAQLERQVLARERATSAKYALTRVPAARSPATRRGGVVGRDTSAPPASVAARGRAARASASSAYTARRDEQRGSCSSTRQSASR
jgi:hypothetical protein